MMFQIPRPVFFGHAAPGYIKNYNLSNNLKMVQY